MPITIIVFFCLIPNVGIRFKMRIRNKIVKLLGHLPLVWINLSAHERKLQILDIKRNF